MDRLPLKLLVYGGTSLAIILFSCLIALTVILAEGRKGALAHGLSKGRLVISSFGGAWGDALQKGFVGPFEAETGIDVVLLPSQNLTRTVAALDAGHLPDVDIVDGGPIWFAPLIRDSYLQPIDYGYLDAETSAAIPSSARRPYEMVYGAFAVALCFDNRVFPASGTQPSGWSAYFDTDRFPGKRAQLDWASGDVTPEIALLAAGHTIDRLYPLDVDSALAMQARILPSTLTFPRSPAVLQQLLIDGEITMFPCLAHRAQKLIDDGFNRMSIAWQQAQLKRQSFAVWRNAQNRENAMRFLAYVATARAQARWAIVGKIGPINPEAFRYIPSEILPQLPTSPAHRETFYTDEDWYIAAAPEGKQTRFEWITQELWPEFLAKNNYR